MWRETLWLPDRVFFGSYVRALPTQIDVCVPGWALDSEEADWRLIDGEWNGGVAYLGLVRACL